MYETTILEMTETNLVYTHYFERKMKWWTTKERDFNIFDCEDLKNMNNIVKMD